MYEWKRWSIWLTISVATSKDLYILVMTFFSLLNDFGTRIFILYQTCVACEAWVTDLQVLQEWQKVPPEDTASLWTINLSIKIWRMDGGYLLPEDGGYLLPDAFSCLSLLKNVLQLCLFRHLGEQGQHLRGEDRVCKWSKRKLDLKPWGNGTNGVGQRTWRTNLY